MTDMIEYLEGCAPSEGCGFLLKSGDFVPCENTSYEGDKFLISAADYLKYSREIEKIVHSHVSEAPEEEGPSDMDKVHQQATGVSWLIVVLDENGKFSKTIEFGDAVI